MQCHIRLLKISIVYGENIKESCFIEFFKFFEFFFFVCSEQTDECTPIQDKKFRLPSSGEDSFTPSSVTPVVQSAQSSTEEEKETTKGETEKLN